MRDVLPEVAWRLVQTVPILLGVALVTFLLAHLAPGDPASLLVPVEAPPSVIERVREAYGFDKPLPVQFALWLGRVVTGDLGVSVATGLPIAGELFDALGKTASIAAPAAFIAFAVGAALGVACAFDPGGPLDRLASAVSILGISAPTYWVGILLVAVFAARLNWLPAAGHPGSPLEDWRNLSGFILPVATLTVVPLAFVARMTRAAALEAAQQDFVLVLRAKGLGPAAIARSILRNALPVALAVMGLQFAYMLGGSILIESVFNWPGAGLLLNNAILRRDIPTIQAAVVTLAAIFVLTNLAVDLLQRAFDPRLRRAR